MKLILKDNVVGLGYKDEIVEVKDGYGRNYLIPQGKAIIASKAALKQHEENMKQRAHKLAQIKADAEALVAGLEGMRLTIAAKTSANGTIFGSVGAAQIAEALLAAGHEIDRKIIALGDPIKAVGVYTAVIKPHREVQAQVEIEVVPESTEE